MWVESEPGRGSSFFVRLPTAMTEPTVWTTTSALFM
jgi:hypothetical protein